MKTKILKSGFGEKLKLLLIPIGLLIGSLTTQVWADSWYSHNSASHIYFNDYTTNWVSDPSSNGITFLMGRDYKYGNNGGPGSRAYRMTHVAHTKIWYVNVPAWSSTDDNDKYQYTAFRFAPGTTGWDDWQGGWSNRPTDRATYGSNTKYTQTKNENITGATKLFTPSSSASNTDVSIGSSLTKYTAYLRVRYDDDRDGTYDACISDKNTWPHGVKFDFTGTYMTSASASAQSKISNLNVNGWDDNGNWKWGYEQIPVTGEVRFELKAIDTGFEVAGWAYSESASAPAYTPEDPTDVTFQVLSNTSYVAFIRRKQYTVTLNDNGGSGGSGSKTVKYDLSSNMTTSVSVPSKLGYTFQGYYTGQDGTGSMVINASGVWQKNVTNYTGTDGSSNPKWIRDDGATLYAKWTQTVDLHDNHGGSNNGSISAIYNGVMSNKSVPTYTDHTLDLGYYAETGCSNKVMNLDGTLVASVTVSETKWTSSTNKWIHDGDGRLYAHWKVNAPSSITCADNVVTIAVPTDATVHYTIDGNTPTGSSPTYDPSDKPVITSSGITVKAIAVQSGCTNSEVTSQAVTYTPVYTVTHTLSNASKSSGETSVLENKAYTAVFTDDTGYDLPTTVSVTVGGTPLTLTTDYTWSVSEGTGTLNILANKITGNVVITVTGVAETYDGVLKNAADETIGTYTATYGAGTIAIDPEPTNTGYDIGGYYLNYNVGSNPQYYNQVATSSKALMESVSTYTDSNGKWTATSAPDLIVKWDPHKYTVYLDQQGGEGGSEYFKVEMNSASYEFGDGKAAAMTRPTRTGYDFAGYYTSAAPSGTQIFVASGSVISEVDNYTGLSSTWVCTSDFITLYAHWTPVALTSAGAGNWNSTDTWTPACVPTKEHDVNIAHAVSVSDAEVAKSVTINQSTGSLTIASTGTLDVIGTISNANEERLEVMAGGALIFDYSSAPSAKVHHSVSGSSTYRYIALPISYVHVSSAFADEGVYTFVWNEGTGWERRGYYDDIIGNEPIAISGQSSWTFYGTLVNALFGSVAYTSGKTYAGTNMYANSWTAPIRISGVEISGTGAIQTVYTDNNGSWTANLANGTGSAVIPAMSAFVILSNEGGGTVTIPYNTAVRNVAVSPASAPKRVASDDLRKHITMNVIGNELKTNLRLYENEQFTNEFDNGWEAPFLEGDGRAGQLYTQTDDKMVILATPDLEGTVVGFIPGEAANYTISFEGDGKGYYLNDLDEQESTLIEEGNTYVFTPNESTNATRFVISKTPINKIITGNDAIFDGTKARKQMIDGILYIIRDGRIYDATGALVK